MDAWSPHASYIENDHMKMLFVIMFCGPEQKQPSPDGLEPPTFRLTAERANQLRHGDLHEPTIVSYLIVWFQFFPYVRFLPHSLISGERPGELDSNCLGQ